MGSLGAETGDVTADDAADAVDADDVFVCNDFLEQISCYINCRP